jgi:hypothetical protein
MNSLTHPTTNTGQLPWFTRQDKRMTTERKERKKADRTTQSQSDRGVVDQYKHIVELFTQNKGRSPALALLLAALAAFCVKYIRCVHIVVRRKDSI